MLFEMSGLFSLTLIFWKRYVVLSHISHLRLLLLFLLLYF